MITRRFMMVLRYHYLGTDSMRIRCEMPNNKSQNLKNSRQVKVKKTFTFSLYAVLSS